MRAVLPAGAAAMTQLQATMGSLPAAAAQGEVALPVRATGCATFTEAGVATAAETTGAQSALTWTVACAGALAPAKSRTTSCTR